MGHTARFDFLEEARVKAKEVASPNAFTPGKSKVGGSAHLGSHVEQANACSCQITLTVPTRLSLHVGTRTLEVT